MRYALCASCGCEWRVDRLCCCVCGNKEPGTLQYFRAEGEEAHRVDLCDACRHYIKTIDCRSLQASDPVLEDLATAHLDVAALQKGYAKTPSQFWTGALHAGGAQRGCCTDAAQPCLEEARPSGRRGCERQAETPSSNRRRGK